MWKFSTGLALFVIADVRPKVVQERLGYSSIRVTLEAGELMRVLHSAQNLRDRAILTLIMDNAKRNVCAVCGAEVQIHTNPDRGTIEVAV